MGSAAAEGDNRDVRAAELALDSPLLNDNHIEGARYVLLNITSGTSEVTMDEVGEIHDYIQAQAGQTAEVIMGIGHDTSLGDKVAVTIIATGFKTSKDMVIEQRPEQKIVHQLTDEVKVHQVAEVKPVVVENIQENNEVVSSNEPVLIIKESTEITEELSFFMNNVDDQQSLEVEMNVEVEETPSMSEYFRTEAVSSIVMEEEPVNEVIRHNLMEETSGKVEEQLSAEDEMYRRSRERILRLKELSYKLSSPNGIADLEKEPAYKRRNVRLDNVPNSSESSVSRFTLSFDENNSKPEIRQNNSFLHDRVD
jgi:cell division protein FtsZ